MDELSALAPEPSRRRITRIRTSSTGLRSAYPPSASPVSARTGSPSVSRPVEILAPTPRRHLIDSSASQHWLRTPPHSPVSSRCPSPASTAASHRPPTTFSTLFEEGEHPRVQRTKTHTEDTGMAKRWVRSMHKRNLRAWVVPTAVLAAVLVKTALGLGPYSGEGTPPMYGDYEAQRHWMELTLHLPFRQWYTYDLQYWGLDYPPLTAYVSWLCGAVGAWIEPSWFALGTSRGIETQGSRVFMRMTVIVLDLLVYIPALVMFARTWQGTRSMRTQHVALLTLLFQPALLLIDSGHFQYNSVMLGFTLLALNFFATGHDLLGAICFVLSLAFKQMALYYAPAIGTYLVAKCIFLGRTKGTTFFIHLASVTLATFVFLFLPFLPPFSPVTTIRGPITRIFPFARGLFEDKVANFWCASNVVFKWKTWASSASLIRLSTAMTALGFLPSVLMLFKAGWKFRIQPSNEARAAETRHTPFLPLLPFAMLTSSMSFFLFSFQVHEKTILLPLLPVTLLLSGAHVDSAVYSWGVLVNNVAVFSMWPLLKRDGLGIQYLATLVFWNRLVGYNPFQAPKKSFTHILSAAVYTAAIILHLLEMAVTPPARYPDLYPVLNVLISTPVFALTWLWSIKKGLEVGWALGGPGPAKANGVRPLSPPPSASAGAEGSFRQTGGRSASLGFAQARRRTRTASSVGGD
ncbi:hypothetical protein C0992_004319 [Termitomyces sp. T32_za158]|nr:hypothetical protein C0992_004319 [Termitomyces sp. T32_za158]